MQHVRVVSPPECTARVRAFLGGHDAVTNLVVLEGAAVDPPGDLVLADVPREATSAVIEGLRSCGVGDGAGTVAVDDVGLMLSRTAKEAEQRAPGLGTDAVVWEEVEARTQEESSLSATYLAFMTVATMIAAFGVLLDQPILIIGAMVVGPEFGPLAGLAVAVVQRRRLEAVRSATALFVGFPIAMVATALLVLGLDALGWVTRDMLEAERPQTSFIFQPDRLSFLVAFLAGIAGTLSLTSAKSGALVGVLISVTTVPAAANAAAATAYRDFAQATGSAVQLVVNLGGITAAALLVLLVQRSVWRREAPGGAP